ncbi:hypothetical protein O4H49_09020 [Kiloniella laminariae]|uniref:Uncharacterized protein n=1 Tax=Kiloniella laminariae TaxID=454162 RepID=A0ABT4LIH6_9PROT|nr:hypothetical protein [Kiloniella laminariae]MCZ4280915.1 hypothetical protein [Kiloniella laminariae]
MSDLEELRQRVEAAEGRFGLLADQQQGYSKRLIALLNVTEQKDQVIEKLEGENEQLRSMLFSLLQAIESGNTSDTLHDMDARISAMTGETLAITAKETTETGDEVQQLEIDDPEVPEIADAPDSAEEFEVTEEEPASEEPTESTPDQDETPALETDESTDNLADETTDDDMLVSENGEEDDAEEDDSNDFALEDDSEDALIAEIAENLEEVLPEDFATEDSEEASENSVSSEEADDSFEIADMELEDAELEDADQDAELTAEAESENDDTGDNGTGEDDAGDDDTAENLSDSIDSFLEKNAQDDETPPAKPEIEDIMERISKQALAQND